MKRRITSLRCGASDLVLTYVRGNHHQYGTAIDQDDSHHVVQCSHVVLYSLEVTTTSTYATQPRSSTSTSFTSSSLNPCLTALLFLVHPSRLSASSYSSPSDFLVLLCTLLIIVLRPLFHFLLFFPPPFSRPFLLLFLFILLFLFFSFLFFLSPHPSSHFLLCSSVFSRSGGSGAGSGDCSSRRMSSAVTSG